MGEWIKGAPHPRAVFAREWAENKKATLTDGCLWSCAFDLYVFVAPALLPVIWL
jgi:hypothetical protein